MAMVTVRRSTIIDAPVEAVWRVVRDFNGHDSWHPAVRDSALEGGLATDLIGAVRNFHLQGGEHLREQLLALSDRHYSMSYCLLEAPLPLNGYVAHLQLRPVTDGGATFWEWHSTFDSPAGREDELAALVGDGVYVAGFEAIRALLVPGTGNAAASHTGRASAPTGRMASPGSDAPATPKRVPPPISASAPIQASAIIMSRTGGPEVLEPSQVTVPPPAADEVRLRHQAIGLNYIDVYCRTGMFDLISLPGTPGLEASGVVLDVGQQVSQFAPGDRVAYACMPPGAYSSVRNMPAARLVRLPDDISDHVAAAIMEKGLTAAFLLHQVHVLKAGEAVLIHAAAGGVGMVLTQWARALGARVYGTVGSPAKEALALANGCEAVINYNEVEFAPALLALTDGVGVDVVIDGVGRETYAGSLQVLASRGHLISYGQASGNIGAQDIDALAARSLTISRPNFDDYTSSTEQLADGARRLFQALRQGILTPHIGREFALADAADAHRWLESRQGVGANLLIP